MFLVIFSFLSFSVCEQFVSRRGDVVNHDLVAGMADVCSAAHRFIQVSGAVFAKCRAHKVGSDSIQGTVDFNAHVLLMHYFAPLCLKIATSWPKLQSKQNLYRKLHCEMFYSFFLLFVS